MTRSVILGLVLLVFAAVAVAACDEDDDGVAGDPTPTTQPVATPTDEPADVPTATPPAGATGEISEAILDAIDEYVLAGNIPSLASGVSVELPEDCDQPGEICIWQDMPNSIGETEASVGILVLASDEFWALDLELQDGSWVVTGHTNASGLGPPPTQ